MSCATYGHNSTILPTLTLRLNVPLFGVVHLLSVYTQDLELAISKFAAQTKLDPKGRRALTSLTYEDVYWAGKIENPLVLSIFLA